MSVTKNSIIAAFSAKVNGTLSMLGPNDTLSDAQQVDVLNAGQESLEDHCETVNTNIKLGAGKVKT